MGLTGGGFIALVAVLAAVTCLVTVLWIWPRLAARGPLRIAGRIGALAVTQVMVLAFVLVFVNDRFEFFTSWDDLLGTSSAATATAVHGSTGGSRGTVSTAARLPERSTLRILSGVRPRAEAARHGELLTVSITGTRSDLRSEASVWLPPQYFSTAYAHRRMPGVEVFPGYPGSVPNLIKNVRVPETFRTQIDRHHAQPMALVLVRQTVTPPRDTECADVYGGPAVETFLTEDLTTAIMKHFRVGSEHRGWATWGYSTGGFCAVKFAVRHPNLYRGAVSISGYYYALEDFTTGDLYGSQQRRNENSPEWLVQNRRPPNVGVFLTASKQDGESYPDTLKFLRLVRSPMRATWWFFPSGGHNFDSWRPAMAPAVDWMSREFGNTWSAFGAKSHTGRSRPNTGTGGRTSNDRIPTVRVPGSPADRPRTA